MVPRLQEEGIEVVLMDVNKHPCKARDVHVDYLPTIYATGGGYPDVRIRGYPTEEAIDALIGV